MNALVAFTATMKILTLAEALETARRQQPQLRQARAQASAAVQRTAAARAQLLPQLSGTASYQRSTANFAPRPGALPSGVGMASSTNGSTFDFFNFGLQLNQQIYDFQQTIDKFRAAHSLDEAQAKTAESIGLDVELSVRSSFFSARAQKELVRVADETLKNQARHLDQIGGFVAAGSRPEIDLAQAKADRANAEVQLIGAQNNYESAKALLNQAIGVEASTDYDVADNTLEAVDGEDQSIEPLVDEAVRSRPDLMSLQKQLRASELTLSSIKGGFAPALGLGMNLTDQGQNITDLRWNWNLQLSATWQLFSGLSTFSQMKEQRANVENVRASVDLVRQQVRLAVDQARLAVRAAKATVGASQVALENSDVRLRLAEGRYQAGVGNIIELGDAQVARTAAAAQRVQADYSLAAARAQLLRALARR